MKKCNISKNDFKQEKPDEPTRKRPRKIMYEHYVSEMSQDV